MKERKKKNRTAEKEETKMTEEMKNLTNEELNEVSGGTNHPAYTHFINHTVVKGDNLHSIARLYGSDWRSIYNANRDKIKDPDLIQNGWVLRVPVV